ncbi:MAG: four-helix bundle copper-binding protein [Magnetococcales bacterium]|nr:four-helix bundle copper-binding protein [Magnetococcales bacterium]
MNRREFIASSGTAAAVLMAQNVLAAEEKKAAPAAPAPAAPAPAAQAPAGHAHHAGHTPPPHMALIQSASNCLVVGQMCVQHCMMVMAAGDPTLIECAKSVRDMLSVCSALQQLAAANSPHLPAMAKVAADVCDACEKECRKHEALHMACKACAEACKACSVECRKVAA